MCFSTTVSFASSGLLIATGIYCIKSVTNDKVYLPLACVPLAFGLQQGFEGVVWSGIHANNLDAMRAGALSFLFFSHWFWLFWPPFMALCLETDPRIQHICQFFAAAGVLYGAVLYLPLLLNHDWLSVAVIHRSIEYQARFIGDSMPIVLSRLLYGLIILVPLFLSSNLDLNIWGILLAASAVISVLVFKYAFVSVWCFFAALLSIYLVRIILKAQSASINQAAP
jgi:hypothetical protein